MVDFEFLQNKVTGKWIILAPRRAHRPGVEKGKKPVCPFCPGREKEEAEVYRIGGEVGDSNWQVRVIPNKYPFAPIHEIIIHSQDHHKNFGELDSAQVELIFQVYRQRYQTHSKDGQVYIFHNRGEKAGESLSHPHSQLVVIPENVKLEIPRLDSQSLAELRRTDEVLETPYFLIFCPQTSDWPDEVWLAPRSLGGVEIERTFGDVTDKEISDLSSSISRLVQILNLRHGNEFPFNFYIYPKENWYLRLIPRLKTLGGFELGTNVFVNTQDPLETINFLKEHFKNPDEGKIKFTQQAIYKKAV